MIKGVIIVRDFETIKHYIEQLFQHPAWKLSAGFIVGLLKLLFGSFRPVYEGIIILWLIDTATGFYYARKNPEIIPESRKMFHGLVKLSIYLLVLIIAYQLGKNSIMAYLQFPIEGFVLGTEGYSILENIKKIGNLKGKKYPIVEAIMGVLQGKINSITGGK